mgnify:CR=1 FL=1
MHQTKIFTIASESELKEQDFIVAESKITHNGDMLIASAIEVKLVEKERYVFTKDELVWLIENSYWSYTKKTIRSILIENDLDND